MRTALLALRATGVVTVLVTTPVLGTATTAQAHDAVRVTVIPSTAAPGDQVEIRAEGCRSREAVAVSRVFANDAKLIPSAFGEDWNRDQAEAARNPEKPVPLTGHARVKASVTGGRYEIDIRCDGHSHAGSGSFDVVAKGRPDPARPDPARPDRPDHDRGNGDHRDHERGDGDRRDHERGDGDRRDHDRRDDDRRDNGRWDNERPGHHREPWSPVRAGGGGTAQLAAEAAPANRAEEHKSTGTAGPGTPHAVIGLILAGVAAVAVAFRSVRRQRTAAGRDAD
ncbi:hypothetical protein ACIBJC_18560 [Streptomyces sp. NPDC050509]|uniref:hypothetical protein n=1 Tax=Streptomyces sp. NPDC050509 TaxID=3365620 RepID=UPI0037A0F77D